MVNKIRQNSERSPAANSRFAIGGFSCSADSLVVAESFVLRIKFSGKNPAHRKSANRCYQTTADKRPQNDLTITQPLEQFFSCADNPIFPLPIKPRSAFGCNQLIHTEP